MSAGRISLICWIFYAVMCAAFLPLAYGIERLHLLPGTAGLVLAIVVVAALWWVPFGYAMYLSMAVTKNGDRRLLKRGIRGTAVVLSAPGTNTATRRGAVGRGEAHRDPDRRARRAGAARLQVSPAGERRGPRPVRGRLRHLPS